MLGRNDDGEDRQFAHGRVAVLGINFVMVFSPSTFAGAPHTELSHAHLPRRGEHERESAHAWRRPGAKFPNVTSVRVKDALDAINDVVGQLAIAIRGASSVALIASVLVLAGALAAGHRARVYDAVVLKTLGATRGRLLAAFLLEYGLSGLATAVFGAVAGTAAAWWILTRADEARLRVAHGRARWRRCCCHYSDDFARSGWHVADTRAKASALSTQSLSIIVR